MNKLEIKRFTSKECLLIYLDNNNILVSILITLKVLNDCILYTADNWSCLLQADTTPVRAVQSFYTFEKCKILILLAFCHMKYLYHLGGIRSTMTLSATNKALG